MKREYIKSFVIALSLFLIFNLFFPNNVLSQWNKRVVAYSGQEAPGTKGAVFSSLMTPNPIAISNSGKIIFFAELESGIGDVTESNNYGYWVEEDGELRLLVRQGTEMPWLPGKIITDMEWPPFGYNAPREVYMDQDGHIGLYLHYKEIGGETIETGFFMEEGNTIIRKVHTGMEVENGATLGEFEVEGFNNGMVLIGGYMNGVFTYPFSEVQYDTRKFIAMYDQGAFNVIVRQFEKLKFVSGDYYTNRQQNFFFFPTLNKNGDAIITAGGYDWHDHSDRIAVTYSWDMGSLTKIIESTTVYTYPNASGDWELNASGNILYVGPNKTISLKKNDDYIKVAAIGDIAEGTDGETFSYWHDYVYHDNEKISILAETSSGKRGIWTGDEAGLAKVAYTGNQAPGVEEGLMFMDGQSWSFAANATGKVGFFNRVGNYTFNGIWIGDANALDLVSIQEEEIEISEGVTKTIAMHCEYYTFPEARSGTDGTPTILNDNGEMIFGIRFHQGGNALVLASRTIVVNSTGDDEDINQGDGICDCGGPEIEGKPQCTLRAAIMEANALDGKNKITFDIPTEDSGYDPASGVFTIQPLTSDMEEIKGPVNLDATSQPGFNNSPVIALDGSKLGNNAQWGLKIGGGDSKINGIIINNFKAKASGIIIHSKGNNYIQGSFIGVDHTGTTNAGMGRNGIAINNSAGNVIGGTQISERNIISGNGFNDETGGMGCGVLINGDAANNNKILGNFIGTDEQGILEVGNGHGVLIYNAPENTVGGEETKAMNLISGNHYCGVFILGENARNNKVQGNMVGTTINGIWDLKNIEGGISIEDAPENLIGGAIDSIGKAPGNLISGNFRINRTPGIIILGEKATENKIQGNIIGLSNKGDAQLENGVGIIVSQANRNSIGGSDIKNGNLISGNITDGIILENCSETSIQNNLIGTDIDGTNKNNVGNGTNGISVNIASQNMIGGILKKEGNVISGNLGEGIFINDKASGNKVRGNLIGTDGDGGITEKTGNDKNGIYIKNAHDNIIGGGFGSFTNVIALNQGNGILIESEGEGNAFGNVIEGNLIGTDITGKTGGGNKLNGLKIRDSYFNKIGNSGNATRNVISGNDLNGILITGASSDANEVKANYIGLNIDGKEVISNVGNGVEISDGATGNNIGGETWDEKNIISGNLGSGILITGNKKNGLDSQGNVVSGNYIGTNAVGVSSSREMGNGVHGVQILDASENTVGGTSKTARNVITGSWFSCIKIADTDRTFKPYAENNRIQGNHIGIDDIGTKPFVLPAHGIFIKESNNNIIGGDVTVHGSPPGNEIYHCRAGIYLLNNLKVPINAENMIQGNFIKSGGFGVAIVDMNNNTVENNEIKYNQKAGISIVQSEENEAISNLISKNNLIRNDGLGIDLGNNGVTLNDIKDPDSGANHLQNFPELIEVTTNSVKGMLESTPNTSFAVELFKSSEPDPTGFGEGHYYLASETVTTDENGQAGFYVSGLTIPARGCVSATATNNETFSTSEFSYCLEVNSAPPITVNSTGDDADTNPEDGICSTGKLNSEGKPECSLRAAIEQANSAAYPQNIVFDIPGDGPFIIQPGSPLPEITNHLSINGITQPGYDGTPVIGIEGSSAGETNGLTVSSGACRITGLAINHFQKSGIVLKTNGGNTVLNNYIGTGFVGNEEYGNGEAGILIEQSDTNSVGTTDYTLRNIIAYNNSDGILINSGTGNAIYANSIHSNNGLGINLLGGVENPFSVTENDTNDEDEGANGLQNYPEIISVEQLDSTVILSGKLLSTPETEFLLSFYSNKEADPSKHGEGKNFIGLLIDKTDHLGNLEFNLALHASNVEEKYFSCTATNLNDKSTSEFSETKNDPSSGLDEPKISSAQERTIKAFPNPSSGSVTFRLNIEKPSLVELNVFDVKGRKVDCLFRGKLLTGTYYYTWIPNHVPNGIYIYQAIIGSKTETGKLLILEP